jgi:hypothetical protein
MGIGFAHKNDRGREGRLWAACGFIPLYSADLTSKIREF